MPLEQTVERLDALGKALRIINAIDADDQLGAAETVVQAAHLRIVERLSGAGRKLRRINAGREGGEPARAPSWAEHESGARLVQVITQQVGKVVSIRIRLETDQIVGEHRLHELAILRELGDDVPLRPRRVQEDANFTHDADLAQMARER